ncbi:MAG: cytidine deaminase [Paludibacter sp.]|nr:cytidine deaminase [Bacteroidales bacterium]MCM1069003.1 cytidine deaminase [Prevotella sp.]MCM1353666.1 cytidine deaminase [Bacteroides sp.]MCM1441985.1 cytidine deaminase [Muribaculum sp.]MCM1481559.1 cytidine deaminase [Paludibacter sp.]
MKEFDITAKVQVYRFDELPEQWKQLVEKAKKSTQNSYNPYSHFAVGAALQLTDGQIFCGANQENAAYPSGLCAERTVMFYANAQCPNTPVEAIAVAGFTNGAFTQIPAAPCGACRQVLLETEHRFQHDISIILYGTEAVYVFPSAKSMLPLSFVSDNLKG